MTLLLVSWVCDHCDGVSEVETPYRGFVVWRAGVEASGDPLYVFPTPQDAERYRSATGLENADIREALFEEEPAWQVARGTIKGLRVAKRRYEIYVDHRYPRGGYRGRLAAARRVAINLAS